MSLFAALLVLLAAHTANAQNMTLATIKAGLDANPPLSSPR